MIIGLALRTRMPAGAFRIWFLVAMIFLRLYIAGAAIYKLLVERGSPGDKVFL
jgi:hypothetical protein